MAKIYWVEDKSQWDMSNIDNYVKSITNHPSMLRFVNNCKRIADLEFTKNYDTAFFRSCVHRLLGDARDTKQWQDASRDFHMDLISYYLPYFWNDYLLPVAERTKESRIKHATWKFNARVGLIPEAIQIERMPYQKAIKEYQKTYDNITTNWDYLVKKSKARVYIIRHNEELVKSTVVQNQKIG